MKAVITALMMVTLTGCAMTAADINLQEARVETNVGIAEYNSIASKYLNKPTFAKVMRMNTLKGDTIVYRADAYDSNCNKYGCSQSTLEFKVNERDLPAVFTAIDKYEAWNKQAIEKEDSITKKIITFESSYNTSIDYEYSFHSGNSTNHFLVIKTCSFAGCADSGVYLNDKSVTQLKTELIKFKSGEFSNFNKEASYK
ncbi:MAG: hypothetical protein ACJAUY_001613 [Cognaticolwellia sp.]|jgi:hypothetical protein